MTTASGLRGGLAGLALLSAVLASTAQAAPSERVELCKGTPPARPDEMIVVDSAFRRMPDKSLRLGTVDVSVSRHVDGQFFIVAPLGARPAATLDATKIRTAIDSLAKCGDKTVFGLSFDFDESTLPPGPFALPLAVFKEGTRADDPALAAAPAMVTGTIKRAWLSAALALAKAGPPGLLELRLTNTGNIPSAPLMFAPVGDDVALFKPGTNACHARALGVGEGCRIDITPPAQGVGDGQFEWLIDLEAHSDATLLFERRDGRLAVQVENR